MHWGDVCQGTYMLGYTMGVVDTPWSPQEELQQARAALRDAKRQLGNVTRPKRRYDQV